MPGIAGIIKKHPGADTQRDIQLMVEAMRHETHYSGGHRVFQDLGIGVGWMGHSGAFDDCMPLESADKNVVIVFQGESFLSDSARSGLQKRGASVEASSARHLLDLYLEFGDELILQLNGWFCGLIVDRRRNKMTLFNDRFGMGRVYFHESEDEFLFASEAKSLLRVRPHLRAIDPQRLAEQLRYNCSTGDRSLYAGVSLLPHASAWEFAQGAKARRNSYFSYTAWEQQSTLEDAPFLERFAEVVSRVFPAYAAAPSSVAVSLTAGLDTRAILAALKDVGSEMPCYTFCGPWRELYDVRTARQLTAVSGQPFSTIAADQRFLGRFGDFATRAVHVSDGGHDAFGAHDIYFNEIAREIAPVRLTGKFGSEVVRIRNLVPSLRYPQGLLRPELAAMVEALPPFPETSPGMHPVTRVVTQEIPWHEYGRLAVEQSQLTLRSPYMDNELVQLMYRAPAGARQKGDLQEDYVKLRSPEFAQIPTNLGRFSAGGRWANKLHYSLLWALFKIEYIYLYATPHWLTRVDRTFEGAGLERIFSGRQKWEGYRVWLKTDFSDFVHDTLKSSNARYGDYFERKTVETMLERHVKGTHNYLIELNRALTLELTCSTLLTDHRP